MKKNSSFKLRSGNKPSIARLSGVEKSPMNKARQGDGILDKIKKHVTEHSYGSRIYRGIKNVFDERGKKFQYRDDKYDLYEAAPGVIPTNKYQAKKIAENFMKGFKNKTLKK
tara:strand:- start:315 stop:650 length:336 start_codon:yes stop_codon:yes gene_type:complete